MMLKDWWQNLAEREQRMVSIGGSVVTVLLLYALVWTPLSTMVTQKRDAVQKQASLLSFLSRSAVTISQLRARGVDVVADDSQDVTTHAETVFSSQGISPFIKQVQQPSANTVIFTFEMVPFDKLMQSFNLLARSGVTVVTFSASRQKESGLADVRVTMKK